ncbi:hypothetical protein NWT39_08435 [Nitrososphaera viennensis]|nr:hypothetical protein [Nitrososphaera viennensis]UVS67929.1 hypothetical protein NWT39_08435 [Nitrososphaera viennensis]
MKEEDSRCLNTTPTRFGPVSVGAYNAAAKMAIVTVLINQLKE